MSAGKKKGDSRPKKCDVHGYDWDYFTALAWSSCLFSMVYVLLVLAKKFHEFQLAPLCENDTFKDYLWYHFCEWFSTSKHSSLVVLTMTVQALCVMSSLSYAVVMRSRPQDGMWRSWGWIVSPDGGVTERNALGRLIGAVTSIEGVIVFALLVSMITDTFASKMKEIQWSQAHIVEARHTVFIQWTDKSAAIVKELATAAESEGGTCIAVLDHRRPEEVRAIVDEDLSDIDLKGSHVAIRSGLPFIKADLEKVAAESAASILILHDPHFPQSECDAVALRKVLALQGYDMPKNGHIVVPTVDEVNKRLLETIGKGKVTTIAMEDMIARLMVQNARQSGLGKIFDISFGFDDAEIYIAHWPTLVGVPFQDVTFFFEDAVPFGVRTASGQCLMPPSPDYVIKSNDLIIVYAEDNDTYSPASGPIVNFGDWLQQHPMRSSWHLRQPRNRRQANNLIIGWNSNALWLLAELSNVLGESSNVTVLSEVPVEERLAQFRMFKRRSPHISFDNLRITHEVGSSIVRCDLETLNVTQFSDIFILGENEFKDGHVVSDRTARIGADGKTVAAILLIQDIVDRSAAVMRPRIVPQILHPASSNLLKHAHVNNYVESNRLMSLIFASVSEEPLVQPVISELAGPDGSSISVRPLQDFLPLGSTLPAEMSFWDIVCFVRRVSTDVVVVGWGLKSDPPVVGWSGDADLRWELNPSDKHRKVAWRRGNKLVVIGR